MIQISPLLKAISGISARTFTIPLQISASSGTSGNAEFWDAGKMGAPALRLLDGFEALAYAARMRHRFIRIAVLLLLVIAFPSTAPAPLIYTPGVGWSYEPPGQEGAWKKDRADEQVEVARQALEDGHYKLATKAAKRTVKEWPLSDYTAEAQYLLGRSYENRKKDEKAFKAYQTLIEKYAKSDRYEEALQRQYEIANRFLNGQGFKLWGFIPFFADYQKTAELYGDIVKNGPYSDIAPQAQMKKGEAWEKRKNYPEAVRAYETAADRYHDRQPVAADALFNAGLAYQKQAKRAEYDQSVANDAIKTFSDFIVLYPNDPRVEEARELIESLKSEQARGSYSIARFYEKKNKWDGALIYYNEVLLRDPDSELAEQARQRIVRIKERQSGGTEVN